MSKHESVLCVTSDIAEYLVSNYPLGVISPITVANNELWVIPRDHAEQDEEFKQLIPYNIFYHDKEEPVKYLVYARTNKGGESRLHDNVSIGFGGHINVQDLASSGKGEVDFKRTFIQAICREIEEELPGLDHEQVDVVNLGVLYDGSNSVGRVHLGIVSVFNLFDGIKELEDIDITSDTEHTIIGWLTKDELLDRYKDRLETWTAIVLGALD